MNSPQRDPGGPGGVAQADGTADGALGTRPPVTETFHGSDPETVAASTICQVSPTKCQARTRLYRDGHLELEGFPVADISDYMDDPTVTVWLDLRDPDRDDLAVLSEEFGLHPLAIEDAVHERERPKLDRYRSHLFLTAYGAKLDTDTGELATSELAAFITRRALITVRKDDGLDIGAVVDRWDASSDLAKFGVGYLLHGLLDFVVDGHFEAVQSMDDCVEALEDDLFANDSKNMDVQRRSFELRKSLVMLRRIVIPMREVVNALMRRDLHVVSDDMMPYYQDGAARGRLDRQPAGPGDDHPGDEPDHPGQPDEHHHQEGHQLGGDHRGADVHHRVLRDERALSRLRPYARTDQLGQHHDRVWSCAVSHLQAQRLAVAPGCDALAGPMTAAGWRSPRGAPGSARARRGRGVRYDYGDSRRRGPHGRGPARGHGG